MTTPLSCTILSCPERQPRAVALAARLLGLNPAVMVDHTNRPGNVAAAMLAWSEHGGDGYHLVMQDDALPSAGFIRSARAAIAAAGGAGVAFWMRPWHPDAKAHRGAQPGTLVPVSTLEHWPPTVALALPVGVISGLVKHQWRCHRRDQYDDDVIGCYLAEEGVPLLACSPSIVEHDDSVASILNAGRKRHPTRSRTHLATEAPTEWRIYES